MSGCSLFRPRFVRFVPISCALPPRFSCPHAEQSTLARQRHSLRILRPNRFHHGDTENTEDLINFAVVARWISMTCHPERSAAQPRDLLFARGGSNITYGR